MPARRTLFDQLDTDGSGGIDGDELAAGLAAKGYQVWADASRAEMIYGSEHVC